MARQALPFRASIPLRKDSLWRGRETWGEFAAATRVPRQPVRRQRGSRAEVSSPPPMGAGMVTPIALVANSAGGLWSLVLHPQDSFDNLVLRTPRLQPRPNDLERQVR